MLFRSFVFGVVLTMLLVGRAASAQDLNLRAVYNAISGVMSPIWVAADAGLFTKHGVNVDVKYLAATSAVQASGFIEQVNKR